MVLFWRLNFAVVVVGKRELLGRRNLVDEGEPLGGGHVGGESSS